MITVVCREVSSTSTTTYAYKQCMHGHANARRLVIVLDVSQGAMPKAAYKGSALEYIDMSQLNVALTR